MILTQKENDCGVCAVANALAVSWFSAAVRIFGLRADNKLRFNTKTKQIAQALWLDEFTLIRVKRWQDIPDRSVVKVIPHECEGTGNWRWVVWRDGKIWDSCLRAPVKDTSKYGCRLVSYLGAPA